METRTIALPTDFHACERGNVWLTTEEGDYHVAWLHLEGNYWIEVSVVPDNYPGLEVSVVDRTEQQLTDHILTKCQGWSIRKLNLDDPRLQGVTNSIPYDVEEEYTSLEECKEQGTHLTSCDDSGYCNYCGEQEP